MLLQKLKGAQLVKKLPIIYGTLWFITAFAPASPILNHSKIGNAPSHFLKICFNIVLQPTIRFSKWSLSLRFPPPKPCMHHSFSPYVLIHRPSHSSRFGHPNNVWYRSLSSSLYSLLHSSVTSSLLGPNIFL